jgi:hypothetical protein
MTSKKAEMVAAHVIVRMQGAPIGAPLPAQRDVIGATGISSSVVVKGFELLCERGYAYRSSERFFWGQAGVACPMPMRRGELAVAGQFLDLREDYLDTRAAYHAAMRVRDGDGRLRKIFTEEIARIDAELKTRSLAVHDAADWRFHYRLWIEGGDRVVSLLARSMEHLLRRSIQHNVRNLGNDYEVLLERATDHKRILVHAIHGDAEGARLAAADHARNVKRRMGRLAEMPVT